MMARLLLLLFCTIYLSLCNINYKIDLNRCKDTACFVRRECMVNQSGKDNLAQFHETEKLKNGKCDIIIQTRGFAKNKMLVMIQVDYTGSSESIAKTGVSLKQGDNQLSCTENGLTANSEIFKEPVLKERTYTDKLVFCSFVIESKNGLNIATSFVKNANFPTLEFSTGSVQTIKYDGDKFRFWRAPQHGVSCDSDGLTSSQSLSNQYLAQSLINTYLFPPITCDAGNSVIVTRGDGSHIKLDIGQSLECNGFEWKYNQGSEQVLIPEDEKLNVVCGAVKFCTLCNPFDVLECPDCTKPKDGEIIEQCKSFTCPNTNNQWKTEDGKFLTGEIECRQETGDGNSKTASWYLKHATNPVKVSKAACFSHGIVDNESSGKPTTVPPSNSFTYISMPSLVIVTLYGTL